MRALQCPRKASGSFSSYAISKMLSELPWLLFKELRAAFLMSGLLCFQMSHYIIRNGMSACRVVAHLTPLVLFSSQAVGFNRSRILAAYCGHLKLVIWLGLESVCQQGMVALRCCLQKAIEIGSVVKPNPQGKLTDEAYSEK